MEITTRLLLPDVAEALRTDPTQVVELVEELHPADLADLATALDSDLAVKLVRAMPLAESARLIESLELARRVELVVKIAAEGIDWAADVAEQMAPDDRADLFAELPEDVRAGLLGKMERAESRDVRQLLAYPEGTAGAIMTTKFVAVSVEETVGRAIETVRRVAEDVENIYDAYAVDPHGTLLGVVSLRDLVISPAGKTIGEIMEPNVIAVQVDADQGEVARLTAKYDLFAVPVIDEGRRIAGIVTVDDIVDVIREEAGQDVEKLGGVEPLEDPYFQTSFWQFVKKRAPWLVVLFGSGLLTSIALHRYTGQFEVLPQLVWFVPLILACGGNAGSQSASLMIRALAVGEIRPRDFGRVIGRELGMGLALGVILAGAGTLVMTFREITRTTPMILTVALSIPTVVVNGALIGAGLPLLLRRLGLDPAVSSTPFIATLSDVVGVIVYFQIAQLLLF